MLRQFLTDRLLRLSMNSLIDVPLWLETLFCIAILYLRRRLEQMTRVTPSETELTGSGNYRSDSGFVLPYVLAVIAILSLLTVVGANTLRQSKKSLGEMASRNDLSRALDNSEALILHVFLTRPMVSGGLDMSGQAIDESELAMGEPIDESELTPEQVWLATGGVRTINLDQTLVEVSYQDADGLVSLNSADPVILSAWLGASPARTSTANALAAKLIDYRDPDNARQFQGAERADYRLAGLPAPSNSVIRHLSELNQIYGFAEAFASDPLDFSMMTLFSATGVPRQRGMPDALNTILAPILGGAVSGTDDLTENQLINSRYPSERAQFTLTAYSPHARVGLRRVVEIERTASAPDRPYTRRRVTEYTVASDAAAMEQTSEQTHVPLKLSFPAPDGASTR